MLLKQGNKLLSKVNFFVPLIYSDSQKTKKRLWFLSAISALTNLRHLDHTQVKPQFVINRLGQSVSKPITPFANTHPIRVASRLYHTLIPAPRRLDREGCRFSINSSCYTGLMPSG